MVAATPLMLTTTVTLFSEQFGEKPMPLIVKGVPPASEPVNEAATTDVITVVTKKSAACDKAYPAPGTRAEITYDPKGTEGNDKNAALELCDFPTDSEAAMKPLELS